MCHHLIVIKTRVIFSLFKKLCLVEHHQYFLLPFQYAICSAACKFQTRRRNARIQDLQCCHLRFCTTHQAVRSSQKRTRTYSSLTVLKQEDSLARSKLASRTQVRCSHPMAFHLMNRLVCVSLLQIRTTQSMATTRTILT